MSIAKTGSVGERIKAHRERLNLSHDRFAARLGTTRQVIIRWENGTHSPNSESRRRLAEVTGETASYFSPNGDDDEEDSELASQLLAAVQAILRAERERVA